MTETDIDTPTAPLTRETEARTPWESIDPDEPITRFVGPRVSTATPAVETRKVGHLFSDVAAPVLRSRVSSPDNLNADDVSPQEREEEHAAIAFFSDQVITVDAAKDPSGEFRDLVRGAVALAETANAENEKLVEAARIDDVSTSSLIAEPVVLTEISVPSLPLEPVEASEVNASAEADPTEVLAEDLENRLAAPPMSSPLQDAREPLVPLAVDDTPWATIDESPAQLIASEVPEPVTEFQAIADEPQPAPEAETEFAVVSRALPSDAVNEAAVTFNTADSLTTAASELATLAEAFTAEPIEQPGDFTIAVPVTAGEEEAYALASSQLAAEPQLAAEADTATAAAPVATGGGWTIPLMCLGIGLIACCMVIPQGEANRRLRYEQMALTADLEHVQKQVAVNGEFLKKVSDDPTLAERLAGRQMKTIRKGERVLPLAKAADDGDMSPFGLTQVAPPTPLPPYRAKTGTIANLCNNDRSRLYLLGVSLTMVAMGLVMGFGGTAKKSG